MAHLGHLRLALWGLPNLQAIPAKSVCIKETTVGCILYYVDKVRRGQPNLGFVIESDETFETNAQPLLFISLMPKHMPVSLRFHWTL